MQGVIRGPVLSSHVRRTRKFSPRRQRCALIPSISRLAHPTQRFCPRFACACQTAEGPLKRQTAALSLRTRFVFPLLPASTARYRPAIRNAPRISHAPSLTLPLLVLCISIGRFSTIWINCLAADLSRPLPILLSLRAYLDRATPTQPHSRRPAFASHHSSASRSLGSSHLPEITFCRLRGLSNRQHTPNSNHTTVILPTKTLTPVAANHSNLLYAVTYRES